MTRRATFWLLGSVVALAAGTYWWVSSRDVGAPQGATYASDGRLLRKVPAPWQPPNLVLLVLDTLRADAVDPPATGPDASSPMPFVSSLAAKGALFRQASSPSPWTMPAVGSLLTGLLPSRHGAADSRNPPALPRAVTTFAELLAHGYGYETIALVDTPWLGGREALGQGFERFEQGFCLARSPEMLRPWTDSRSRERPFFLYLHATEPHEPYGPANHPCFDESPPPPVFPLEEVDEPWELARSFFLDRGGRRLLRARDGEAFFDTVVRYTTTGYAKDPRPELLEALRTAYREGARFADQGVERLVGHLQASGALENTVLVVTSDHGECLGEHGLIGHGRALHEELVRVPLVVVGPEPFRGGKVVEDGVGLIDVMPTFLELAGLAPLDGIDGRSFLRVAQGTAPGWPVVAEEIRHFENAREPSEVFLASARTDGWKYVLVHDQATASVREELYDLLLDPGATSNLAGGGQASPTLDPVFCAAVERVRDSVWALMEASARAAGGAAGPLGKALPARPEPCEFQ